MQRANIVILQLLAFSGVACGDARVEPGEARRVLSATAESRLLPARVLQTTRRVTNRLVSITTAEGTVVTTPEHLFARFGGDWTPASQLAAGDKLVSETAPEGSTIEEIATREVGATDVYNLTVARSHSYLVGSSRLLVHNVDCRPPAGRAQEPGPSRGTRALEQERRREQVRAHLAEARQEHQQRLEEERRKFNDSPESRNTTNCVYCTVGGLSDYDKLSVFLREHGLNDKQHTSVTKNYELLEKLGLRSAQSPASAKFQRSGKKNWLGRENPQRDAKKFMQESSSNTFALIIKGTPASPFGHSLIAVRQADGSIVYVDLQKIPPATYDRLNPSIQFVEVIPTDVDWRFNRELTKVVTGSTRSDPRHGWPQ